MARIKDYFRSKVHSSVRASYAQKNLSNLYTIPLSFDLVYYSTGGGLKGQEGAKGVGWVLIFGSSQQERPR